MRYLADLNGDELLCITPSGCDVEVMEIRDFLQSEYYIDGDDVNVAIAAAECAQFDLFDTLENLDDGMHDDWFDRVTDDIPNDVRERIEQEVNSYLDKHPTYYAGETVDW